MFLIRKKPINKTYVLPKNNKPGMRKTTNTHFFTKVIPRSKESQQIKDKSYIYGSLPPTPAPKKQAHCQQIAKPATVSL